MTKYQWLAVCAFFAATLLCVREILVLPDGKLHLHILDVGQGSAALLITPTGRTILVDGGPDTTVLERLGEHLSLFQRTIDLLVISHADLDHIGGIPDVLQRYDVRRVLLNGEVRDSAPYAAVLREIRAHRIPVLLPDPATDIDMSDGVLLDVIWPAGPAFEENASGNGTSLVVRVLCGSDSVLLPGDIEMPSEAGILRSGADIRSDILIAAHHGSTTSSSTGFLLATEPSFIAISAGRGNAFGHPHAAVINRYAVLNIQNKVTAEAGTLSWELCE
ncbi:MBL fold metallo-hydrolase [Candidatus Peregrinibacteria bacterium]|nr:MBL fold metallo-hydrolase [Candidatus Peregrinibacteria bacterium]